MKILIAEDEQSIALLYRIALESRGHEVIVTKDGQECIEEYTKHLNHGDKKDETANPFDTVVLDYRMPRKDGLRTAKEILGARPHQRIVFASAFVRETLLESVKELDQVVELLQKPFEIDVLVDTVEDKTIYEELKRLNVDIQKLKNWNPTHSQVRDLLDGLMRIRKPGSSFCSLLTAVGDNNSDRASDLKSPR